MLANQGEQRHHTGHQQEVQPDSRPEVGSRASVVPIVHPFHGTRSIAHG